MQDLTALLWSSIDNDDSRDLDQIEWAERTAGGIRVLVGIADVDCAVAKGTPIDLLRGGGDHHGLRRGPHLSHAAGAALHGPDLAERGRRTAWPS